MNNQQKNQNQQQAQQQANQPLNNLAPLNKEGKEACSISNNDTNFIFNGGEEITEFQQERKIFSENRPAE
ncbi:MULTISPECIES: hypothetical protein [Paenibacillus]|uniref:hypothetical protein n=1 Tax=Paenibacillus TaxID=44249 RepID=UPI00203F8F8B|nr:hypothetical protein [Paenibacillus camelliae]MCM3631818.1 hypothetical protein [Paenibacillus camelliae]